MLETCTCSHMERGCFDDMMLFMCHFLQHILAEYVCCCSCSCSFNCSCSYPCFLHCSSESRYVNPIHVGSFNLVSVHVLVLFVILPYHVVVVL